MIMLENMHPDVHKQFTQGMHVIRRSDHFWAGLSPDLVIEQVLMRCLKTTGGLTRWRRMAETLRLVWCLARHACAEVNSAMQHQSHMKQVNSTNTYHMHGIKQTRLIPKSWCRSLNGGLQRLIISGSQANELANALTYELFNYPPALFEAKDILVKAVKSQLAAVIWSEVPLEPPPRQNVKYVLDGGALLHNIYLATWGYAWQDIAGLRQLCDKALSSGSGRVWWVRGRPSTKYSTHERRTGGEGRKVTFNLSIKLQLKKDDFLSNKENKQRFLDLLGDHLAMRGCEIAHITGDADVPIIQVAVTVSDI